MNRLILDYFRRKAWILALGGAVEFGLGMTHAAFSARHGHNPISGFQFQVGIFMGAFLLSLDLQRGAVRAVATLPLTARQIGRAWWAATVGLPALAYSALLALGTASFCLFRPEADPAWDRVALSAISLLIWMGAAFTVVFNLPTGLSGNGWQRLRGILFSLLWGLMLGCSAWFLNDLPGKPVKLAVLLGLGLALALAGWFRAGHLVLGRAGFRATGEAGSGPARDSRPAHRPGGRGGLGLLVSQTCLRVFLIGLAMLVAMPLITLLQGRLHSWNDALAHFSGPGFLPSWFVLLFALMPAILQLRLLRSLPISTSALASTLLAMIVLPMAALGALSAGVTGLALGAPAALEVAKSCLFMLVPATLAVAFATWRGLEKGSYFFLIFVVMLTQFGSEWLRRTLRGENIPVGWAALVATLAIAGAFLLTRRALQRGTHAYRAQGALAGAWGANR